MPEDDDDLQECWRDVLPRKPKAPPLPVEAPPAIVFNLAGIPPGMDLFRMQAAGSGGRVLTWIVQGTPDFAGNAAPSEIVPGSAMVVVHWRAAAEPVLSLVPTMTVVAATTPLTIRDCEHGNESPNVCPCPPTCYCRMYSCG